MTICDAEGRDCIEENSSKTFHCNTTCVGIYADIEWVKKDIEVEISEEESEETMRAESEGKIDDNIMKMCLLLGNKMKLMKDDMKDMKDKEKYKMLVSEYRNFKTKNVKHVRFNSDATFSDFGQS